MRTSRTTLTATRIRRMAVSRCMAAICVLLLPVASPAVCKAILCPLVMSMGGTSAVCAPGRGAIAATPPDAWATDSAACPASSAPPSCHAMPCGMSEAPACPPIAPPPPPDDCCAPAAASCASPAVPANDASGCPLCVPCDLDHVLLVPVAGMGARVSGDVLSSLVVLGLVGLPVTPSVGARSFWLALVHHPPWGPPGGAASLSILLCCYRC